MAIVYVGTEYTTKVSGQRTVDVTCEKCGTFYRYEMTLRAAGKGSASYLMGHDAAADRATAAAWRNLDRRLANEAELVPCPGCNWVNEDAVRRYRTRYLRWIPGLIPVVMLLGFVAMIVVGLGLAPPQGTTSAVHRVATLSVVGLTALAPVWMLLLRALIRRRLVNPNATFPNPPVVPLSTPPALVVRTDPKTGKDVVERIPSNRSRRPK